MLALAAPAAGEVVVTKKTIPIPPATLDTHPVYISMTNNGINNFRFDLENLMFSVTDRNLVVRGLSKHDGVEGTYFFNGNASALPRGAKIGPVVTTYSFFDYGLLIEGTQESNNGRFSRRKWAGNLKNHYLGVTFRINGQTHYGWIRLTVTANPEISGPSMTAKLPVTPTNRYRTSRSWEGLPELLR